MSDLSIDEANVPVHVGIIMDGNGRWAQNRNIARSFGHKEGLETARKILTAAAEIGIKYVTLYVFSTENWKRTKDEVGFLMTLITNHLRSEVERYLKDDIRLLHLGDINGLPSDVQNELKDAVKKTTSKSGMTVVLAINYGGKDEILRGINKLFSLNEANKNELLKIDEKTLENSFDIPNLPPVDLLIRTGGEKRLSNFLLWHAAYAELSFSDTLWPDYTKEEFLTTIVDYQHRNRRFGGVK
ncbi:MAG: di-trans,poly-cis-decaprenylcistransferase [Treponema sp.]|nr:di-trans,poly-cis-decaprenylcistransferase [Treponema sp.]